MDHRPSLDVGENIFKIKVTAEDTTTTKTYQVTITRSAAAPDAPASLTASPGNAEATLTWTAAGLRRGRGHHQVPVPGQRRWRYNMEPGLDRRARLRQRQRPGRRADSVTVTGLTNGTLHTFQVRAVNSEGGGSEAEDTATPGSTTLTALVCNATANTSPSTRPAPMTSSSYNATVANSVDRITVTDRYDNTPSSTSTDDMELRRRRSPPVVRRRPGEGQRRQLSRSSTRTAIEPRRPTFASGHSSG